MSTQTIELSDSQLDGISGGGCYRPEPPKCDPKPPCHEPKKEKKHCGGYEPKHHDGWDWKEFWQDLRKYY